MSSAARWAAIIASFSLAPLSRVTFRSLTTFAFTLSRSEFTVIDLLSNLLIAELARSAEADVKRAKPRALPPRADPGHDPPDTREQPAASDRGSRAMPSRVARILWLLPDPTSAHQPGGMDPPKATSVPLAAMAKRPQPLQRTAPA